MSLFENVSNMSIGGKEVSNISLGGGDLHSSW